MKTKKSGGLWRRGLVDLVTLCLMLPGSFTVSYSQRLEGPPSDPPADPPLSSMSLALDYPTLEVPENRAYIPLIFNVVSPLDAGGTVTVRATFAGGTATPGEDFSMETPEFEVPAAYGYGWIQIPLLQDEANEGKETALFDLSIVGGTAPPVRMAVTILDDLETGEVGFVSPRFSANEASPRGFVTVRLWRTLNSRNPANVTIRIEGKPEDLATLGGESRRSAAFQSGESQVFLNIPLTDNTIVEGSRDFILAIESSDDGAAIMPGFETTTLTLADDESTPPPSALSISEDTSEDGERGAVLSTLVPRGFQVRLEYSDNGLQGPWQLYWIFEGADTERTAFNRYSTSVMRMFRTLPPEPLELSFPW
jgi:hypothetical protein